MAELPAARPSDSGPRFTICVPIWNGARFVERVLDSVLAQEFADLELIIGDNASTDELSEIVARYADRRIRLHRWEHHVGPNENFNRTMALASSDWVIPIGADDRLRPDALARFAAALAEEDVAERRVALVVAACRRVLLDGRSAEDRYYGPQRPISVPSGRYDSSSWLALAATGGPFPWNIGSIAFSRSALIESGAFRPDIGLAADMELVFRLATVGDVVALEDRVLEFAVHDDSDGNIQWARTRQDPKSEVPLARAILAALSAHDAKGSVASNLAASVRRAAALAYVRRAAQHRTLPGGLGRGGALRDLARAFRHSRRIVLDPWAIAVALGSLAAPASVLRFVSANTRRRQTAA